MFRMLLRSRSASIHCKEREAGGSAGWAAICGSALVVCATGSRCGAGVGGGADLRTGGGTGGGWGLPLSCSTNRRIPSASTLRPRGVGAGERGGAIRGTALGAGRAIGATGRDCGCGDGIRGLGRTTGGALSAPDESSLADCCSLPKPLPMAIITMMISQITPPVSASFIMLA